MTPVVWRKLPCRKSELRLDITLNCGQSFRWKKNENGEWFAVMQNHLWFLTQDETTLSFQAIPSMPEGSEEEIIKNYFQLDINLEKLYTEWSSVDDKFSNVAATYQGVRMLRQDPVENLFSFICSSNNNIQRITGMIEKLCSTFGEKLLEHDGQVHNSFPTIESLAEPEVENVLRNLGFGYRAKFIQQSAIKIIENGGRDWLVNLRTLPYQEAKTALMTLPGIGAKVADCICLMSLNKSMAIPVDTHVFQIAKTYLPHLSSNKTVTERVYNEIVTHFQKLYGPFAGWAHSVLFSADLRHLKPSETTKRIRPLDGSVVFAPSPKVVKKRRKKN